MVVHIPTPPVSKTNIKRSSQRGYVERVSDPSQLATCFLLPYRHNNSLRHDNHYGHAQVSGILLSLAPDRPFKRSSFAEMNHLHKEPFRPSQWQPGQANLPVEVDKVAAVEASTWRYA